MNIEFNPGVSPMEQGKRKIETGQQADMGKLEWETIVGLEEAIKKTKEKLNLSHEGEYSFTQYNEHLKSLESSLVKNINQAIEDTKCRIIEYKTKGADTTFLQKHLDNLYQKLQETEGAEPLKKAA